MAVAELTSLTIGVKLAATRFGTAASFAETTVSSSNVARLTVKSTGTPSPGRTTLTPVRTATAQQSLSSSVADAKAALGGGTIELRTGGSVTEPIRLDDLRGGAGVARGSIRITDRDGKAAVVDLSNAVTIADVVDSINGQSTTSVTARIENDRLVLSDRSGGSNNLRVDEVSGGTTAADLGLGNVNTAASSVAGSEIAFLSRNTSLSRLLDGQGIEPHKALPEFTVSFTDGSSPLSIDLSESAKTLGDLLDTINAADPARLEARIAADGDRIELIDKTGTGIASVAAANGSKVAEKLGLVTTTGGATVSGTRLHAGLTSKLIGTLGGGKGLGTLGTVTITDRAGATATVDLAGAETLDDIAVRLSSAGVAVEVTASAQGTGLAIRDKSGGSGQLSFINADATNSADKLGLTTAGGSIATGADRIDGAALAAQSVFRSTKLDALPGGKSVDKTGRFTIQDSNGKAGSVDFSLLQPKTIGDVIDAVNALDLGVKAEINRAGDGIQLIDTAGGARTVTVTDSGTGTAAASLKLKGLGESVTENGQTFQRIDGSFTTKIKLEETGTLEDLAQAINDAKAGVTASIINDGSPTSPFRLVLTSEQTGRAGAVRVDLSDVGLSASTLAEGHDAVVKVGGGTSSTSGSSTGLLLSSATNTFANVLPGVEVTLNTADGGSADVSVVASQSKLITNVKGFVDQVNKLRDKLDAVNSFNPLDGSRGILYGSGEVLRIESGLTEILTASSRAGDVRSLRSIGIELGENGKLTFNEEKFRTAATENPAGVEAFFTTEKTGFVDRIEEVSERLTGLNGSVLLSRGDTLQRQCESLTGRIDSWNTRLTSQKNRLLKQFYNAETVIGRLQTDLSSLSNLQAITPLG